MKKTAITLAVLLVLGVAVSAGYAFGPKGNCGNPAAGTCPGYTNLTPEQQAKVDQFRKDVAPLHDQVTALRTEVQTLRSQANPDWNLIEQKRKEMVELTTKVQKMASDAGITGLCGQCDGSGPAGKMGKMGSRMGRMM